MPTHDNSAIHMAADVAGWHTHARQPVRGHLGRALRITAPILIVSTCLLFGTAARAQNGGYMRALTSHGQVAGGSTDPRFNGWILLEATTMPSAPQIAAMADETVSAEGASGEKAVHKPVVVVKEKDQSSLALLGAYTSHQHFPEIDIVVTSAGGEPIARYKLTDATIVSVRAGDTDGGTHEPLEQVRIGYAKIEIQQ
jgi:type VI secretion system Hcp family effector